MRYYRAGDSKRQEPNPLNVHPSPHVHLCVFVWGKWTISKKYSTRDFLIIFYSNTHTQIPSHFLATFSPFSRLSSHRMYLWSNVLEMCLCEASRKTFYLHLHLLHGADRTLRCTGHNHCVVWYGVKCREPPLYTVCGGWVLETGTSRASWYFL